MITVVDCQLGNVGSIRNMLKRIGVESKYASTSEQLHRAKKLILPGVGSFDHGMSRLIDSGLRDALDYKVLVQKTPVLGICLGMQLFANTSEEGKLPGLGWIEADVVRFSNLPPPLRIPHMGWKQTRFNKVKHPMGTLANARYYYVHSYHIECRDADDILATATHGAEFVSAVIRENIIGVQFHPEKSHTHGMQLLAKFAEL